MHIFQFFNDKTNNIKLVRYIICFECYSILANRFKIHFSSSLGTVCSSNYNYQWGNLPIETISHLDPFPQAWMIAEYFHAGFGVGIVCRLEAKLFNTQLSEEFVEDTYEQNKPQSQSQLFIVNARNLIIEKKTVF